MALVRNSDALLALRDAAKLQQAQDVTPTVLGDRIIPVIEMNPRLVRYSTIVKAIQGSGTIYSVPSNQDFYLTGFCLTAHNDTTGTGTACALNCTVFGAATNIAKLAFTTLTEKTQVVSRNFSFPIKCDRGTAISITEAGSFTQQFGQIQGYLDNASNS